uniref:Uncharacterized protein n=1 Tax=Arundo donax TaxID=35708 RepID=A0A0A9BZU3_ARUDO
MGCCSGAFRQDWKREELSLWPLQ